MSTTKPTYAVTKIAQLLREVAQELRETATRPPLHEWEGDEDISARTASDEYLAAADAVDGLIAENASLQAQLEGAGGAPSEAPHAELRKTWREGQRWQTRGSPTGQWLDTTPCWHADQEYRRHPDSVASAAPVQTQEDAANAARYQFLRDGEWRDTDLESFIRLQLNALWDAKIDAAIAAQQAKQP